MTAKEATSKINERKYVSSPTRLCETREKETMYYENEKGKRMRVTARA